MAYDEELAQRLRTLLAEQGEATEEKKMFGGLGFLVRGNMSVAASGQGGLLARIGPEDADECLARPGAEPMEMRGRTMTGWIRVSSDALASDNDLGWWVDRSLAYVRTLPPK